LSQSENVGANQKPNVPNRSGVVLVAATTTQYTGTRKYSATTTRIAVTMMVDAFERPAVRSGPALRARRRAGFSAPRPRPCAVTMDSVSVACSAPFVERLISASCS
jgi:hypothetical protein